MVSRALESAFRTVEWEKRAGAPYRVEASEYGIFYVWSRRDWADGYEQRCRVAYSLADAHAVIDADMTARAVDVEACS